MRGLIVLAAIASTACAPETSPDVTAEQPLPKLRIEYITEAPGPVDPVTVAIAADGGVTLDGEPLTLEQLDARFAEFAAQPRAPEIYLSADRQARFSDVRKTIGLAWSHKLKISVLGGTE